VRARVDKEGGTPSTARGEAWGLTRSRSSRGRGGRGGWCSGGGDGGVAEGGQGEGHPPPELRLQHGDALGVGGPDGGEEAPEVRREDLGGDIEPPGGALVRDAGEVGLAEGVAVAAEGSAGWVAPQGVQDGGHRRLPPRKTQDSVRFIWYRWCPCCLVFWGRQLHPLRRDTVKARCFAVA